MNMADRKSFSSRALNYVLRRVRNFVVFAVPSWDRVAARYVRARASRRSVWFYSALWRVIFRSIYVNRCRDRLFPFICAFYYQYAVAPGDTVVQIGASEGEETVRLARAVGETGLVVAIEPEPANYQKLRDRIAANQLANVKPIRSGAWSAKGALRFFTESPKSHRVAELPATDVRYTDWLGDDVDINSVYYSGETTVDVDTVDNLLAATGLRRTSPVRYVLIETNGAEYEVLKGMTETLPRVQQLTVRAHVRLDGEAISKPIMSFLSQSGFHCELNREGDVLAWRPDVVLAGMNRALSCLS